MNIAYLELRYSGGPGASNAAGSLGDQMSSSAVRGRTITGSMAGVSFLDAPGCASGAATLAYNNSTKIATFAGPSGVAGSGVNIGTNGRYILKDSLGQALTLEVINSSSLPSTGGINLTIAAITNNIFDDVTKSEAFYGDNEYRCLYLMNTNDTDTFYDIRLFLAQDAIGADGLFLGVEGSPGDTAQTIANENTAPSGVNFSNPLAYGTGVPIAQLDPGEAAPFWVKRVVPVNTETATSPDTAAIGIRAGY